MKRTERPRKKASSASRAAELLTASGPPQKPASFGFGGSVAPLTPKTPDLGEHCLLDTLLHAYRHGAQAQLHRRASKLCLTCLHHLACMPQRHSLPCRFSGAQQISPAAGGLRGAADAGSPAGAPEAAHGELDGELAQHLRRLSKRDPTTKAKALQVRWSACSSLHGRMCSPSAHVHAREQAGRMWLCDVQRPLQNSSHGCC